MSNDPDGITAWQRLDARTTTSGKLVADDIERLARLGVRHVINLAPDGRDGALDGEADLLAQHDMRYTYIPVPFDAPGEDHFSAFVEAYESSDDPVHVHCIANYRVSAFFFRYHRDMAGMDEDKAHALMEQQWSPKELDHEVAPVWVSFVSKESS